MDGDGVDGVQELDGVHGDLRSEAKCVQELDGVHGAYEAKAKCTGFPLQRSRKASALRPLLVRSELSEALPHFCVGFL